MSKKIDENSNNFNFPIRFFYGNLDKVDRTGYYFKFNFFIKNKINS